MGSLNYANYSIEFDDRALLHLQIVIVHKLRRGEGFLMSWRDSLSVGSGRSSIWLQPSIPLLFKFTGSRTPTINRAWLEQLARGADSSQGLVLGGEPPADTTGVVLRAGDHPTRRVERVQHTRVDLASG